MCGVTPLFPTRIHDMYTEKFNRTSCCTESLKEHALRMCLIARKRKQFDLKTKYINWLTGKNISSIYRKQITHLQSDNQTEMERRNRTVRLRQQVQHSQHTEIPIQNSQSHSKCTLICDKSYPTYRLQHPLRK